jgi:alkylation response protein AidB-like acyl-CoA dehydrogenase
MTTSVKAVASRPELDDDATGLVAFLRAYATTRLNSRLADARRCLPPHVVLDFGRRGLFGLRVPRELGGLGLGWRAGRPVIEQLAAIDLTLTMLVGIHNELGIGPILRWGTPQARAELLPLLATGRMLGGLAITEQGAGSNPHAICSSAVSLPSGGWRIRGQKIFVGNGSWAGIVNVFARRGDEGSRRGIIGVTVPTDSAGVRIGPEAMTLGMRAIVQNQIWFDDVDVDGRYLLGNADGDFEVADESFRMARLGLAIAATGAIKRCAQLLARYALRRKIWTGPLGNNPVFRSTLRAVLDSVEILTRLCGLMVSALDEGLPLPAELFFVCKILAPEHLWFAADNLVQWLGGRGYIEANEAPQILRDARLFRIFEGPTEAMKIQLGSMWQARSELRAWLRQSPDASAVVAEVESACDEIWNVPCPTELGLGAHTFARRHAIGNVVAQGVGWWLLRNAPSSPDMEQRGQLAFEDARRVEARRVASAAPLDVAAIAQELSAEIGDVAQTMGREDWMVDDLLAAGG